jgi:hypothetical protein
MEKTKAAPVDDKLDGQKVTPDFIFPSATLFCTAVISDQIISLAILTHKI